MNTLKLKKMMSQMSRHSAGCRPASAFEARRASLTLVLLAGLVSVACLFTPGVGRAQALDRRDVLVVYNGTSVVSRSVALYYAYVRRLAPDMVLPLSIPLADATLGNPADEEISRADYETLIRDPIADHLATLGADAPHVIATVMGVPLRITDTTGSAIVLVESTGASVDAELAVMGSAIEGSGGVFGSLNPYFGVNQDFVSWRAANPDAPLRYLVTRLAAYQTPVDGFGMPASARALIDRAQLPADPDAVWLVDEDGTGTTTREPVDLALLRPASALLRFLGKTILHDTTQTVVTGLPSVAAYASWGSNDSNSPAAPFYGAAVSDRPGQFTARSIAATIVSTNARSFVDPPVYGQSLIADLIELGVAGAAGNVAEPGAFQIVYPQALFARYAAGAPVAEAYYSSLPYLGWMNVWVGDPLMRLVDPDADFDGVEDRIDRCGATPVGSSVDAEGCSQPQFCAQFDPIDDYEAAIFSCLGADWNSDELSSHEPKDCTNLRDGANVMRCVPGED